MNAVADLRQDVPMSGEDPHGLHARMLALGLLNKDIAERLDLAPNTVTRAIRTDARSEARPRIDALLTQLEQEREAVETHAVTPPLLDHLVGQDKRLVDVRIEYSADGRTQRLVALLVSNDLSPEQMEQAIREWRKGYDGPSE